MKDNLFYRLFAKADLTDTVKPDFTLSPLRHRKIARDAMWKIKAAESVETTPDRVPRRRALIAAAALMLAVVIPISAVGISHVIWRPDVGLTDLEGNPVEADASVYTSTEAADFGGLRMTYVIWTNTAGGSTLSVWLIGDHDGSLTDLTAEGAGKICTLTYNGSDGEEGHNYICTDFPFTETVTVSSASLGAEAVFTLAERENPSIFVPEHFGISFELIPDGDKMHVIIIDRGILGAEMIQYARQSSIQGWNWKFYDAEGNCYITQSGGGGIDDYGRCFMSFNLERPDRVKYYPVMRGSGALVVDAAGRVFVEDRVDMSSGLYTLLPEDAEVVSASTGGMFTADSITIPEEEPINAADIVRVELDEMIFRYRFNKDIPAYDLPIPADGETLTGDYIAFDLDGFTDRYVSIKREGNKLIMYQPDITLDYTGTAKISESESTPTLELFDSEGRSLGKATNVDFDFGGTSRDTEDGTRTIAFHFAEGTLNHAASAKMSISTLWIYLDQAWSVDLS
ncbi:MAG: hypothetical protein IJX53_08930 [Clostridia bacterium]|nr:hypothetical protein [Clostridia bacterium]